MIKSPTGIRTKYTAYLLAGCVCLTFGSSTLAEVRTLDTFHRQQLSSTYFSEGVHYGDLNNDGQQDIIYGPHWYAGPDFTKAREIYAPVPQPTERYADHFFCWTHDFDSDGWQDVLVVGFPGTPAYVYQNPGSENHNRHWPKHEVFDWVSNESPQWKDLVGDERPELICTRDGYLGYVTPQWDNPWQTWKFQRISDQVAPKRFGHGLGVGDINGDGKNDVLMKNGWYAQPNDLSHRWEFHSHAFASAGGADMFAYDVDGDGDQDVITSLDAHNFGLAWFEQVRHDDHIHFHKHVIMGTRAEDNPYGVVFTELHSLALADIDGDGLKDICTGKTYYSHHRQSPMWDAGAVVYWFKLSRGPNGVEWLPYRADTESGIGRQLVVADVNGDEIPDMLAGGMKGCHVLLHNRKQVPEQTWLEAQPRRYKTLQAGLSPEAAAKQMTAPPGFHVQLAAGEPLVHQPVAFTTDHRGRVWVAEAYTYPRRAPEGEGKDKIVILEDTDLDGTLDSRKEFLTGLNLVSGLEVGFGGVWIGAAPYLIFVPDQDGDDVPDGEPQILVDGFGYQDTHETLNAFIWGPDGWLYGCHGVFTHSNVGKPNAPDEQRVPMNAAVWRYHPTRHEFDIFARGTSNPWGVDFNDHGQAFITACVIPHLWHVIQGARYHRQGGQHFNPHLYDDIKTIADHSHYTGNIRDSAWWGHEPELSDSVSIAGGGHAHCGAMIYLGNNWPASYRNSIYFNNIHGNRVNNDTLERRGSGYVGRHGKDFLMANDKWYRGINLKSGPDGSVHVIDWYDRNACHRTTPEIWDRSNGRIYRVRYGEQKPLAVDLSKLSDLALAELQAHDNEWHVRTARRLLQERAHAGNPLDIASQRLRKMLASHPETPTKLRALWTLYVTGNVDEPLLRKLLSHDDEHLRAWAVQLAVPTLLPNREPTSISQPLHRQLVAMTQSDDSSLVRLYIASALQRIPHAQRWDLAQALLQHAEDASDHNLPLMIWYGIEPLVPADSARAMELAKVSQIPVVARYIVRRAAGLPDALNALVQGLTQAVFEHQSMMLDEMLQAFADRVDVPMPDAWRAAYSQLLRNQEASVRNRADRLAAIFGDRRLLPRMRDTLSDDSAAIPARRQALQVLLRARDPEAAPALLAALKVDELQVDVVRALANYREASIPERLLTRYSEFSEAVRRDVIATLTARPEFAKTLMDAVASAAIPRRDIHAYHIRQLRSFDDRALNSQIQNVWGVIQESSAAKKQKIAAYKERLQPEVLARADLSHGRVLFNKTCAACHRLFGEGYDIGPDLTGSNRANLDYLLENAVDPSSVVSNDYKMSTLALADGRVVTGLILRESDSAVTVRTVNDELLVAKADIEQRSRSPLSLMPEGQLDQLPPEDVRDLVAYLASPSQVPLPRIELELDPSTGKVLGALEGEALKIVGKTGGNVASQGMGTFKAAKWSGQNQLWWTGQKSGAKLSFELPVSKDGTYWVEVVLTRARDYGRVQLALDDDNLGSPIDCFAPDRVDNTGVLRLGPTKIASGTHRLHVTTVGKHPRSTNFMFGLDYVRLVPAK